MSAFKRTRTVLGQQVQDEIYTLKFRFGGKQHMLATGHTTQAAAEKVEREVLTELRAGRIPNLLAQLKQRHTNTVNQILDKYVAASCPDRGKVPRVGTSLDAEKRQVETLRRWWGPKAAAEISDADQDDYHTWRLGNVTRGTGHRATELELVSLRNALSWAVRTRLLQTNPIIKTYKFRDSKNIEHARQFMPDSGDELHRICGRLMADPYTQGYAWEALLSALTGLRHSEIRLLLANPQRIGTNYNPGHFDDRYLVVKRGKRGCNNQVQLDDPDRPQIHTLLRKIRAWQSTRHPTSPWLIPEPDGHQLAKDCRLSKALQKACTALRLPERHAHGLRAYYASVRLAHRVSFDQVAFELGQRSGEDLVRDVYGIEPAEWKGLPNTYTWLPNTAEVLIAWETWDALANVTSLATALATTFDYHQSQSNATKAGQDSESEGETALAFRPLNCKSA